MAIGPLGPFGENLNYSFGGSFSFGIPGYKAASVQVDQMFVQAISKASDFNVIVQQKIHPGDISTKFRAHCQKCGKDKQWSDPSFISRANKEYDELLEFCEQHRHGPADIKPADLIATGGRRFREE